MSKLFSIFTKSETIKKRCQRILSKKMVPMPLNSCRFMCWLFKNSELCIQQLARSLCLTFLNIILIYFSKCISLKWFVFCRLHYLILHNFGCVFQQFQKHRFQYLARKHTKQKMKNHLCRRMLTKEVGKNNNQ